jgi:3-hydroxyisobutyrate dehydrogenase
MTVRLKAGFIGLGVMGYPMALNLSNQGNLLGVWNRTSSRATDFSEKTGARSFESPQELTREADVLILCVSRDQDVLEIIDQLLPELCPGKIVVDCSTVSQKTAILAADRIRLRGADFLDCPVTGGVEGAKTATLTLMVGGETETLKRARPLLEGMSRRIVHMGPTGAGQATKAVNQVLCAGINEAVTEGLAFAEGLGLDLDLVIDAVSAGAAGSWFLDKRGRTMTQGIFEPGFKLALHHKDLKIVESMAKETEVPLPLTNMTRLHYETLMSMGFGEEDISALYRLKRAKSV